MKAVSGFPCRQQLESVMHEATQMVIWRAQRPEQAESVQ